MSGLSEEVDDSDVDKAIEEMRRKRRNSLRWKRKLKKGDYVKFSHEGSIDGQPIAEIIEDKPVYAKMPQTWEEVGGEQGLIPGLGDQLQGLKTGDKQDLEVEFPENFNVEQLQGKKAVYSVEILEVRERKLPEMDEAFFESQQVKDLDELKERVSGWIKGRKQQERRADLRRQVTEKLLAQVDFPLPESLLDMETENSMRQVVMENVQRGVAQEDLEKNKEDIHAQSRKQAESSEASTHDRERGGKGGNRGYRPGYEPIYL